MVLDDICSAKVYSANAFYLLGIPVDISMRKLRRREEDLIDGIGAMGEDAWTSEFARYLLGHALAPKIDTAHSLIERLKNDPEYFATEMFFWFWPQREGTDADVDKIINGERDSAIRSWIKIAGESGVRGIIARHNLAIALHYYAIDGENQLLMSNRSGDDEKSATTAEYVAMVDCFWKSAFRYWEELENDDMFWHVFSDRVRAIDDPRLGDEFIATFRERFPMCFDSINADFMVAYARRNDVPSAKRHFDYMVATMSGDDDVEETMECAFKPFSDKINVLIKQCNGTTEVNQVLAVCRKLLNESSYFVQLLQTLIPSGNSYTRKIINDIVAAIDKKLPLYSRNTGDFEPCLQLTKQLLGLAATPLMKDKIQKSIEEWEELVRKKREECTCCVCGKYHKDITTKPLKLYRDVSADPTVFGRVQWRTRTIQVPVCSICADAVGFHASLGEHAKKLVLVKQSIAQGWKIGDEPSQSELDAVRFL